MDEEQNIEPERRKGKKIAVESPPASVKKVAKVLTKPRGPRIPRRNMAMVILDEIESEKVSETGERNKEEENVEIIKLNRSEVRVESGPSDESSKVEGGDSYSKDKEHEPSDGNKTGEDKSLSRRKRSRKGHPIRSPLLSISSHQVDTDCHIS